MSLKRAFIQLPIKKQIYFGIFGMEILTCANVFILISATSLILSNLMYRSVKLALEKIDNNTINYYSFYSQSTLNIHFDLSKSKVLLIRLFYNIIDEDIDSYYEQLSNIDQDKETFLNLFNDIYYIDSPNKKLTNITSFHKKLFLLRPLNEEILKNRGRVSISIIGVYFIDKETKIYAYYSRAFESKIPLKFDQMIENITLLYSRDIIQSIFYFNTVEECIYKNFTTYNPFIFNPLGYSVTIAHPALNSKYMEYASFEFDESKIECGVSTSYTVEAFKDYIALLSPMESIGDLTDGFTTQANNLYTLVAFNTKEMQNLSFNGCLYLRVLASYYLNDDEKEDLFTINNDMEAKTIYDCFSYKKTKDILKEKIRINITEYNTQKILIPFASYSDKNDINHNIPAKIFQFLGFNHNVRSFLRSVYLNTVSFYIIVVKLQNRLRFTQSSIQLLFLDSVCFIMLCSILLWVIIFIILWFVICKVASNISEPISKLIKNISISELNKNGSDKETDVLNRKKIVTYQEDKDVNDLFKICQNLIEGSFTKKKKEYKQEMNVYNNVTLVKTNNFMINEFKILKNNNLDNAIIFKDEIQQLSDRINLSGDNGALNNELKVKIKEYNNAKLIKLDEKKKVKPDSNENEEYLFLKFIHEEIKEDIATNNLYRLYTSEVINREKRFKE